MQMRDGSFDTLRLIAALMVFHSHSFALAGLPEPQLPGFSWGGVAVIIFFAMSGYWVSRSALERSLASFAVARTLRIAPGLFVCGLVTIAACALATSEIVNDYFRNPDTWRWLQNTFPFWIPQRTTLPGVFEDGAVHHPNGSLWTLPYEVLCYVLVALAALFGRKGLGLAAVAAGVFAATVAWGPLGEGPLRLISTFERLWLAIYGGAFFVGVALRAASDRLLLGLIAAAAVAVVLTHGHRPADYMSAMVLYAVGAIWAGRNLNLDRLATRGRDISYGVYIYAFPFEQLAVRALPPHDGPSYALYYAVALAATLAFAALSWALVEKPALGAKARITALVEGGIGRLPLRIARAGAPTS